MLLELQYYVQLQVDETPTQEMLAPSVRFVTKQ